MRRFTVVVIVTVGMLLVTTIVVGVPRQTGADNQMRASIGTSATTTTSPGDASPTTSWWTAPERPVGYIVDPLPAGFVAAGAFNAPEDPDDQASGMLDVWATPGASRSGGRWLTIATNQWSSYILDSTDPTAQRVRLRDRVALRRLDADGIQILTIDLDHRWTADITSHAIGDDELADLMADISVVADTGRVIVGDGAAAVFDGMDLLTSGPAALSFTTAFTVSRYAFYQSVDGVANFSVSAGAQHPNDLLVSALLNSAPAGPLAATLAPDRILTVEGRAMLVSQSGSSFGAEPFLMWHDGNQTVSVSGNVPVADLVAVASAAHQSTPDEWVTQMRTHATSAEGTTVSWDMSSFTEVGRVTTTVGDTWVVAVSNGDSPPLVQIEDHPAPDPEAYVGDLVPISGLFFADDLPRRLATFLALDATVIAVVIEAVPGQPIPATVRITVGDGVPLDIPFVPIKDTSRIGAGYAFSQVANFTAELIGADGASLGTLTH